MEKILLVSRGNAFFVNAIRKNLTEAEYEVISVEPSVQELKDVPEEIQIILFYLGSYIEDIPEALVYLKDMVVEQEKALCLIGDNNEFEMVEKSIPTNRICHKFERPLDLKKMVEDLKIISAHNNEEARKKSILLVDDDAAFLVMVKEWLSEKYNVVIVNSGMQAITYLANHRPDLILLDYDMPITPGPQVMEMIRSETKTDSIPIIFLTGKGDRESVMKVLELKPQGYLLKSKGRKDILEAIDHFFETRKWNG